jgi:hypothetical protein
MSVIGIYRQSPDLPVELRKTLSGVPDRLVVRELNEFAKLDITITKMQDIISTTVGREPVAAINLLSPSSYCKEEVLVPFPFLFPLRHHRAAAFYNYEIAAVHLDATVELRFSRLHCNR